MKNHIPPPLITPTTFIPTARVFYDHWPRCSRAAFVAWPEEQDGFVSGPVTCGRWRCPDCCVYKARKYAGRIFSACPERAITLTCRVSKHPALALAVMKKSLPRLISKLRKLGYVIEYAAVWELTKKGMPHVHLATWGTYIPKSTISKMWHKLTGAFIVDIITLDDHPKHRHNWTKYLTKAAGFPRSLFHNSRRVTFSKGYRRYRKMEDADAVLSSRTARVVKLRPEEIFRRLQTIGNWTLEIQDGQFKFIPDADTRNDPDLNAQVIALMKEMPRLRG